jgi:rhodanese-related sulfurtransferase
MTKNTKICLLVCITLSLFLLIPSAGAFEIAPANPNVGDEIIVTGDSPTSSVPAKMVFTKTVPVEDGTYLYYVGKVAIPEGPNNFIVEASNVEDLVVKAKLMFWLTAGHPSATGGKASYSMSNVPKGSYSIKLTGEAQPDETTVDMKITATSEIPVKEGHYEFKYSTSSMPEGDFTLTIDGETKTIHLNSLSEGVVGFTDVTVSEAKQMIDNKEVFLLDARTQAEFDGGHIQGATLIPYDQLSSRLYEVPSGEKILVYCKSGGRSVTACNILVNAGYTEVYNVDDGITAWNTARYPVVTYNPYDENENYVIDIGEVSAAIDDYRTQGPTSIADVSELIDMYRSCEPYC